MPADTYLKNWLEHPEHVRQRAALSGRFQLGPVFGPGRYLSFHGHVGMLGHIGFRDGLHAGLLIGVPEREGDGDFFFRHGDGRRQRQGQTEGQQGCQKLTHV